MTEEHSKTGDPAVGSTRLVRWIVLQLVASMTCSAATFLALGTVSPAAMGFALGMAWSIVIIWVVSKLPPNKDSATRVA